MREEKGRPKMSGQNACPTVVRVIGQGLAGTDPRGKSWWVIYHSYSPVALWKTYSLPLTVSTPSFRMHFLQNVSAA